MFWLESVYYPQIYDNQIDEEEKIKRNPLPLPPKESEPNSNNSNIPNKSSTPATPDTASPSPTQTEDITASPPMMNSPSAPEVADKAGDHHILASCSTDSTSDEDELEECDDCNRKRTEKIGDEKDLSTTNKERKTEAKEEEEAEEERITIEKESPTRMKKREEWRGLQHRAYICFKKAWDNSNYFQLKIVQAKSSVWLARYISERDVSTNNYRLSLFYLSIHLSHLSILLVAVDIWLNISITIQYTYQSIQRDGAIGIEDQLLSMGEKGECKQYLKTAFMIYQNMGAVHLLKEVKYELQKLYQFVWYAPSPPAIQ